MQRFLDVLISGISIALLVPVLVLVALVLRFTGEHEILYKQTRVGRKQRPFLLMKFATMLKASPSIGSGEITIKNDPRVLPFGKYLRKSKINELPQLWNVLNGDMSIVGPRPMVQSTFEKYPEEARELISQVRPGLTGVGSIIFRDEEKLLDSIENPIKFYDDEITPHKIDLESWYIRNNSIALYIKVILLTAWVIPFPSTTIIPKVLKGLPELPSRLK